MSARTMGRRRKRELCCLVLAIVLPAAVSGNSFTGRLLRRRRAQEDVVVNLTVTEPPTEAPLVEEVIPYEHVEDIEEEHGAGMTVVEDYVDEEEWLVDTSNTSLLENPLEEVPPLLTEMDYDLDMDEEEEEEDEEVYPADADFAAEGQFDSDYDEGGDGEDVGEDSEAEVAPTDAGFAAEGQFESEYYEDSQDSVAPAEADFGEEGQFDSEYQGGDEEEFGEDEEVEVTPADAGFSAEGQFDSEYEGGDEEEEDTEGDFVVEPYSVHESFETEADEHTEDETYSLPVTESSQYQVLNPPWLAQDEPTVEETSDSATTYQVISPPWITSAEDTAEDSEASAPVSTAQGLSLGFAQQSYTAPSSAPTLAPTEDKSDSTLGWTTEGAAPKGGQVVYPFWNPPAEEDKEESIDEDEEVMQLQVLKPVWWTDKNESEGGFFEGDTDKWEVAGADEAPSSNSTSEETPLTNSTSDEPLYLEQAMEMGGANESVANDTTSTNVSEGSQPEYTDITIHYLPQRPPPGKGKGYVWNDYPRGPHPSKGSPKMPKGSKGCDMPSKKGGKKKKCSESQKSKFL